MNFHILNDVKNILLLKNCCLLSAMIKAECICKNVHFSMWHLPLNAEDQSTLTYLRGINNREMQKTNPKDTDQERSTSWKSY